MKDRITQTLLTAIAVVLLSQLLRSQFHVAQAEEAGAGAVPAVLRAHMIELVDEAGQIRANLKLEPNGEVVFRMRDAKGTIRVKLGAAEDGSGLLLINDQTEPGVQLLAKSTGTTVTLTEKGKEKRVITP